MMKNYLTVSLLFPHFSLYEKLGFSTLAIKYFNCMGVEEFIYSEKEVDELLQERSYSGGNLTDDVYEEIENHAANKSKPIVNFFFDEPEKAHFFQKWVENLNLKIQTQVTKRVNQDWNTYWRSFYQEIALPQDFQILPSWKKNEDDEHKKDIIIYPGMGFGTGNHETTYLCLVAMFEKITLPSDPLVYRVLDFGCGSGILGIGALKYFKNCHVDFYDIDQGALENCRENLALNNIELSRTRVFTPEQRENILSQGYQVIFANILENVLLAEREFLQEALSQRGSLILSGILKNQEMRVREYYEQLGICLSATYHQGDWVALIFKGQK